MGSGPTSLFARGAAITLGSTLLSCLLALQVEATAHRFLFWLRPQLYSNVDQAYGLTEQQLYSVKQQQRQQQAEEQEQQEHELLQPPQPQRLAPTPSPSNFTTETLWTAFPASSNHAVAATTTTTTNPLWTSVWKRGGDDEVVACFLTA